MRLLAVLTVAAVLAIPAASPARTLDANVAVKATALDAYAAATSKTVKKSKAKSKRKAKVEYMRAVPVK